MNRQQSFIHYLLHNNAVLINNYNELIKKTMNWRTKTTN